MAKLRWWPYWGRFGALAVVSLGLLFLFIFNFLPQRFLLELGFSESGYAYPVIRPPLPVPPPRPPRAAVRRPIPRGPAERFWATYGPLVDAGEDSAAIELVTAYIEAHPEDQGVAVEYARLLWRLDRLADADLAYRRALAMGAGADVRLELARLRAAAGDWDTALSLYEVLVRGAPDDAELVREYAEMATWAERYDLALTLYAQLTMLEPSAPQVRFDWARVLYWAGRPELAAELLKGVPRDLEGVDSLSAAIAGALPVPPGAPPPPNPLERARELAMTGRPELALVIYRLLLDEDPVADSLLLEMADVYEFRADAPERALAMLRIYQSRHPDDQDVRLRMARLMAWSGELDAALATADTILRAQPENAAAWALLGDLRRWSGELRGARRAYERALAIEPQEPRATEGHELLEVQVDRRLAARGDMGPVGSFDFFVDSDDYGVARMRGGWFTGSPRTRIGAEAELEGLSGYDLSGAEADLVTASVVAAVERWWLQGDLRGDAKLGAWAAEDGTAFEPLIVLSLTAPYLGGAYYRLEYRHGPAYRATNTLEAAIADLRLDEGSIEHYRLFGPRWNLSARAGLAYYSGAGDDNWRSDARLGVFFRAGDHWALGYETGFLGFADPAPRPGGRRLYWDPRYYWLNSAVVTWTGEPAAGWELDFRLAPGLAYVDERGAGTSLPFQLDAALGARRRWGVWTLGGRAGFGQSRADGYRSFNLNLELSRRAGF